MRILGLPQAGAERPGGVAAVVCHTPPSVEVGGGGERERNVCMCARSLVEDVRAGVGSRRGSRVVFPGCLPCLSGALEPLAGAGDSDRLVHDPLADAEIFVHPLADVLVVAGDGLGFEAARRWPRQLGRPCEKGAQRDHHDGVFWGTHVKPVDRRMPARMVETATRDHGSARARAGVAAWGMAKAGTTY